MAIYIMLLLLMFYLFIWKIYMATSLLTVTVGDLQAVKMV